MKTQILQYNVMVETALRAVVRQALTEVAKHGLPGTHHFYITFRTSYPGVRIPDYLQARYPTEMTIVLQFQFYDLEVDDETLGVTLTFNNAPERLVIPLKAITVFADPSVNFALPFQPVDPPEVEVAAKPAAKAEIKPVEAAPADKPEPGDKSAQGVSLDKFRKK